MDYVFVVTLVDNTELKIRPSEVAKYHDVNEWERKIRNNEAVKDVRKESV